MDPYVGEIRLFAGSYAPSGWAFCDGQELSVMQNQLLFAVIGNTFGGDGRTTYKLPDLRGRVPIHQGTGPGLTPRAFASSDGEANVTLTSGQIPNHTHSINSQSTTNAVNPTGAIWATVGRTTAATYYPQPDTPMNTSAPAITSDRLPCLRPGFVMAAIRFHTGCS